MRSATITTQVISRAKANSRKPSCTCFMRGCSLVLWFDLPIAKRLREFSPARSDPVARFLPVDLAGGGIIRPDGGDDSYYAAVFRPRALVDGYLRVKWMGGIDRSVVCAWPGIP